MLSVGQSIIPACNPTANPQRSPAAPENQAEKYRPAQQSITSRSPASHQSRSVHSQSSFHTPWTEHSIFNSHFSQDPPTYQMPIFIAVPGTHPKYKRNMKIREQYKRKEAQAQVPHVTVLVQEVDHIQEVECTRLKSCIGKAAKCGVERQGTIGLNDYVIAGSLSMRWNDHDEDHGSERSHLHTSHGRGLMHATCSWDHVGDIPSAGPASLIFLTAQSLIQLRGA